MKIALIVIAALAVIVAVQALPAPESDDSMFENSLTAAAEEDESSLTASAYMAEAATGAEGGAPAEEGKGKGGKGKGKKDKKGKGGKGKKDKKGKGKGGKGGEQETATA